MTSLQRQIPLAALTLGLAGLIPFVALAAGALVYSGMIRSEISFALVAYAAVILSFLGGVHWGGAIVISENVTWPRLITSVIPSLFGWVALLMPEHLALALLVAGFLMMLMIDVRFGRKAGFPQWYIRLRWLLSSVVLICLAVVLIKLW